MSASSYAPLDSYAPTIFSEALATNYMNAGFLMLLLYDHVITLDKEVDWIWTLQWRLPKVIFIVNRYAITPLLVLVIIPAYLYPLPLSFCKWNDHLTHWMPLLNLGTAELLMIIRVSTLYGNRKHLVWSFCGLWFRELTASVVTSGTHYRIRAATTVGLIGAMVTILFLEAYRPILGYQFLPGCWTQNKSTYYTRWNLWAVFLLVEGALMLLTAYKLLSYRNRMNRAVVVLARDSIVYFTIVFVFLLLCFISHFDSNITVNLSIPTQCITSIAVGRMMMNIRGLILDDPEHTIYLQTFQFVAATNSDSGIELEVVPAQ